MSGLASGRELLEWQPVTKETFEIQYTVFQDLVLENWSWKNIYGNGVCGYTI